MAIRNQCVLLTEFEVLTVSGGPSIVPLWLMAQARDDEHIMVAGFCNKKISNELINVFNIVSIFPQQWMVIFSPILCFCWSLPSFSFTLNLCPKMLPNFLKLKFPPKQISLYHPYKSGCCFCFKQTILRFPHCGHFWKYVGYLLICSCGLIMHFQLVISSCLQTSLASLMTTLSQSHPYFVHCVKPNEKKVWNNHGQVIHQVLWGAFVFLWWRVGNKEGGAWWLGCVPGSTQAHNITSTALQTSSDALEQGSFQSTLPSFKPWRSRYESVNYWD